MAIVLYGVAIHKAAASGDLKKMKAAKKMAERFLAEHGNVSAALEVLNLEITKLERKRKKK